MHNSDTSNKFQYDDLQNEIKIVAGEFEVFPHSHNMYSTYLYAREESFIFKNKFEK